MAHFDDSQPDKQESESRRQARQLMERVVIFESFSGLSPEPETDQGVILCPPDLFPLSDRYFSIPPVRISIRVDDADYVERVIFQDNPLIRRKILREANGVQALVTAPGDYVVKESFKLPLPSGRITYIVLIRAWETAIFGAANMLNSNSVRSLAAGLIDSEISKDRTLKSVRGNFINLIVRSYAGACERGYGTSGHCMQSKKPGMCSTCMKYDESCGTKGQSRLLRARAQVREAEKQGQLI